MVCVIVPAQARTADEQPSVLILLPGQFGLPTAMLIASGVRSYLIGE